MHGRGQRGLHWSSFRRHVEVHRGGVRVGRVQQQQQQQ